MEDNRTGYRLYRVTIPLLLTLYIFTGLLGSGCASVNKNSSANDSLDSAAATESDSTASITIEPTVVEYTDFNDPLIRINRAIFSFNDVTYRYALIPLSKGYTKAVPEPVRGSIGNFFYNIKTPIYFVNNVFQFKPKAAGRNLLRFGINSTLGLLGLFDPAHAWFKLEKADTNFSDTLAYYGADYGFYLVLPLLGPSDLRGGTSAALDYYLHPIPYLVENDSDARIIQAFDYFQEFAPTAEQYEKLKAQSEDPYIFFRNLHLQRIQRDADYPPE